MNPVADLISWLDKIPFVGYLRSLIYYRQGKKELAAEAFKCTTHNTAVALFGVEGGTRAGKLGPVISVCSGIAGGLLSDVSISILSSNRYGYLDRFWDRNMDRRDWVGLIQFAIVDGVIGFTAYELQQLVMYSLNSVIDQIRERSQISVENESQSESEDHVVNERGSGNTNRYNQQTQVGEVNPQQSIDRDGRQSTNWIGLLIKSFNLIKNTCECLGSISSAVDYKSHQMDTLHIQLAMICIIGILGVLYLLLFYMVFKI